MTNSAQWGQVSEEKKVISLFQMYGNLKLVIENGHLMPLIDASNVVYTNINYA